MVIIKIPLPNCTNIKFTGLVIRFVFIICPFQDFTNKLFEKTDVKKTIQLEETLSMPHLCDYLEESKMARNINQSSLKRVSEVTSDKKGELNQILQLLKTKRNMGNQETKNHYFDLIQRIEKALNNTL